MADNLIEAHNISYKQSGKLILDNVSLSINKGDFTTIIGPNGAGKTSLIKILLDIKKPNNGNIKRNKNLKIGYLPQKINIDNSIPINVEYFLKLCQEYNTDNYKQIIEQTRITDLLNHQLYSLSGGQMQNVLLAKALLGDPDLLILDEPAQNLDISSQLGFYQLLQEIYHKKKITIIMVSHDLHMVMSATKNVICLYHHICCQGKPEEITKDPKYISIFGKDMSKLISSYNHYHNHNH